MLKSARLESIVKLVEKNRSVSVKDLASMLDISEMTIRRDLDELDRLGMISRVHGGAKTNTKPHQTLLNREFSHNEKRSKNIAQKHAIAQCALSLIQEGDTIFLGTGTTVERLAPLLPDIKLRIVTNSLAIFELIENRPQFELFLVGGCYKPSTMAFVGPVAEAAMDHIGLTKAFIGANGIVDNRVFTSSVESGQLQKIALDVADERYLLADSSKCGVRDFYSFYSLNALNAVITDDLVDMDTKESIERFCELKRAKS